MANLGNGANDIIRAYSPGGRAHDIAGTQDDIGTLTRQQKTESMSYTEEVPTLVVSCLGEWCWTL